MIDTRIAIILLSFLIGLAMSLAEVSSQAFLLSVASPGLALVAKIAAGFAVAYLIRTARPGGRRKFSVFFLGLGAAVIAAQGAAALALRPAPAHALGWHGIVLLAGPLLVWALFELNHRHHHLAEAQALIPQLLAASELGTLAIALAMRFARASFTPARSILISSTALAAALALTAFAFVPRKAVELKFAAKEKARDPDNFPLARMTLPFAALGLVAGLQSGLGGYLVNTVLKERAGSYEAIRRLLGDQLILSCVAVIVLNSLVVRIFDRKRTSPTRSLGAYFAVALAGGAFCFLAPGVGSYVLLGALTRTGYKALYATPISRLLSGFTEPCRGRFRAAHLAYFGVGGAVLAGLPPLVERLGMESRVPLLLGIFLVLGTAGIAVVGRLRAAAVFSYSWMLSRGEKSAQILAAHALSALRPPGFGRRMTRLLSRAPKTVLRKTAILGLGFAWKPEYRETVEREFETDQEEIQIAVIETLLRSGEPRGIQFVLERAVARGEALRLRVRMAAARGLRHRFGSEAITFLLHGLDSPDSRVVAETIEVLTIFNESRLVGEYERCRRSPVARVRAVALSALAHYPGHRREALDSLAAMVTDPDLSVAAAGLYGAGMTADRELKNVAARLLGTEPARNRRLRAYLAWALARSGDARGLALFVEIFERSLEPEGSEQFLELFSRLAREQKLEILERLAERQKENFMFTATLTRILKSSGFDFHEELAFAKALAGP